MTRLDERPCSKRATRTKPTTLRRLARLAGVLSLALASGLAGAQEGALAPKNFEPARLEYQTQDGAPARCLGVWAGESLVAPSHCLSLKDEALEMRAAEGNRALARRSGSLERDYALLGLKDSAQKRGRGVMARHLPTAAARVGERIVTRFRSGWVSGRIRGVSPGGFWVESDVPAQPGDSGAAIWTLREGRWEWLGMLVSGVRSGSQLEPGERGEFNALSVSAIAWGPWRP